MEALVSSWWIMCIHLIPATLTNGGSFRLTVPIVGTLCVYKNITKFIYDNTLKVSLEAGTNYEVAESMANNAVHSSMPLVMSSVFLSFITFVIISVIMVRMTKFVIKNFANNL